MHLYVGKEGVSCMCGGVQMSVFMPDVFECVREYERVFTRVCFTCVKVPICSYGDQAPLPCRSPLLALCPGSAAAWPKDLA